MVVITSVPPPTVASINLASIDPTTSNKLVDWTVTFSQSVTGVDSGDFALVQSGGAVGASITGVTGSGSIWTVTANTGTGTAGSLQLRLIDNDTIMTGTLKLGGDGLGNGNFSGQAYTLLAPVCTGAADVIFCDDFERANPEAVGNGWTITEVNSGNCNGTAGNRRCAGIDSDIPPFDVRTNPRANTTRAMFTRWNPVYVTSPVINMDGKSGGQLSFWMRRGHDSFSECPEAAGENYLVQYYASDNTWKILAQYPSSPSAALCDGKIFTPTIELPPDALHANLQLRFYQPSGSGSSGNGGAPGVRGYDYWHMDDVIVRETTGPKYVGAFCDNFEGGLGRWSISAEGSPSNATIGDASLGTTNFQSSNYELDMRWGYVAAATFKTDLTGVSGNISYWVQSGTTNNLDPDNGEDLVVEYFNSAGTWSNLTTYLGSAAAGTIYNASFPIPANAKHANFRLRFRHLNASGYDLDYWHVDDVCVGDLVPTADLSILKKRNGAIVPGTNASYAITVTNNGPGTLSGSVEVTDTLPASLSFLGASGTDWTCSANFQAVTCGWSGTLANGASAPPITLTVAVSSTASGSVSNTASVTGTSVDNNPTNNSSTDTAIIYIPSYVFTDAPCTTGVAIGSGACNEIDWSGRTAGQSLGSIYITALNSSGIPTQLSGNNPTTINFEFGMSCLNPTSDAGVQGSFSAAVKSPGNPTGTLELCAANGAVPSSWSSSTALDFPASSPSVGPYAFNYADVGEIELYVRNANATSQIGQSGPFIMGPAAFVLSAIKCTTADAAHCGAGALPSGNNPGAVNAGGPTFIRAGDPFSLTVTSVGAGGAATPNFGREVVKEGVTLTPDLVLPAGGNNPAIANNVLAGGTFTGGVATPTDLSWGEVGIITLTANLSNQYGYLGTQGSPTNFKPAVTSGNIGRFYPHHFDTIVTTPMNCAAGLCPMDVSGAVYSGQAFTANVFAKNASNGVTANYSAGTAFAKNVALSAVAAPGGATLATAAPSGTLAAAAIPLGSFIDGSTDPGPPSAPTGATPASPVFTFAVAPSAPLAVYVRAVDSDGVTSLTAAPIEGGAEVLSGRYRIANAHGSELLPLPITVTVQYYNGINWVTSSTDNVTSFNSNLAPGGNITAAIVKGPLAGVNFLNPGIAAVNGGVRTVNVAAPGAAGSVDLSLTAPSYLLGGSNVAGVNLSNTARATFGIYKGTNEFIYQRENY